MKGSPFQTLHTFRMELAPNDHCKHCHHHINIYSASARANQALMANLLFVINTGNMHLNYNEYKFNGRWC